MSPRQNCTGIAICRNIKTLFNFEPLATEVEIRDASLQFIRKLCGFNVPSKASEAAFERAVEEVAASARDLIRSLVTTAEPRTREVEAARARARSALRFRPQHDLHYSARSCLHQRWCQPLHRGGLHRRAEPACLSIVHLARPAGFDRSCQTLGRVLHFRQQPHSAMTLRDISIFTGEKFAVPQHIQRIDWKSTHGWQVRYHETKMLSDHSPDGSGPGQALVTAAAELVNRVAELPAPPTLQKEPSASKTTNLPRGISGPVVRSRAGSIVCRCHFSVLPPMFGRAPSCSTVDIGNENAYTVANYQAALAKAIALRHAAEVAYERVAAKAKRRAAAEMKAVLRQCAAQR